MPDQPSVSRPRLKLRLTAAAETAVRRGHPWIYSESILDQSRPGELGELAVVYNRANRFLALGLFDPDSPLRVRILHRGRPVPMDSDWWRARAEAARRRREGLFDAHTNGFRCLHGESDGWPGMVLDRYDTTLVLKLYTAAWLPWWPSILPALSEVFRPERLVLRLSRNIQERAEKSFDRRDGEVLSGEPLTGPVPFSESGLRFEADVVRGQKTGFFLDQRENRRQVERLAAGRAVLNLFSFSGAFSVYAARGGARKVTDVDMSPHALASAARVFALNRSDRSVAACHREGIQADVFEWLAQASSRRFDLIIVDPPSLARREAERERALQAYGKLVRDALRLLRPRGILVAASCSAHVAPAEFFTRVRSVVQTSGARPKELAVTGHPPDHPATFPEAEYLKCIYLRLAG